MAVDDDVKRLAALDIVYLTRSHIAYVYGEEGVVGPPPPPAETFQGRLRQELSGEWVFTTATGHSGVVGFSLGRLGGPAEWASSESPEGGLVVRVSFLLPVTRPGDMLDTIWLSSNIPSHFTD